MTKPNKPTKRRAYPEKYRRERAQKCRKSRPWDHATGPKTDAGKDKISGNALKHGFYSAEIKEIKRLLIAQRALVKEVIALEMDE